MIANAAHIPAINNLRRQGLVELVACADIRPEAAQETARQIRLRNLSGIILVDFVNMDDPEMEETLFQEFRFYLTKDPIQTTLVDITALGLAEVTRKKVRKPLYEMITV